MSRFLVLVLGTIAAFLIIKYRRHIRNFTGEISFAERYFSGGTMTFIAICGVLTFILSLMYTLGTLQSILQSTVGRFF